jgi:hypothetical protein
MDKPLAEMALGASSRVRSPTFLRKGSGDVKLDTPVMELLATLGGGDPRPGEAP